MIPKELLRATENRGVGVAVYGGPGMKKSNAIHTLPPPILMLDFEGGAGSVLPWIRRRRESSGTKWEEYSDKDRQGFFDLLKDEVKKTIRVRPSPYIDIISFDNLRFSSYNDFITILGNFDYTHYNSLACDPLQEFSAMVQTFSKGEGRELADMELKLWAPTQERSQIALRRLRNYRDEGVFIYLTGSEDIAKDYVKDPREKKAGEQPPEPYSIRGTVNLPGKLAGGLAHLPDVLAHARLLNGQPTWVTEPEALPGGYASWDAKDRYGRLDKFEAPSFRSLLEKLYGKEGKETIYAVGTKANAGAA